MYNHTKFNKAKSVSVNLTAEQNAELQKLLEQKRILSEQLSQDKTKLNQMKQQSRRQQFSNKKQNKTLQLKNNRNFKHIQSKFNNLKEKQYKRIEVGNENIITSKNNLISKISDGEEQIQLNVLLKQKQRRLAKHQQYLVKEENKLDELKQQLALQEQIVQARKHIINVVHSELDDIEAAINSFANVNVQPKH